MRSWAYSMCWKIRSSLQQVQQFGFKNRRTESWVQFDGGMVVGTSVVWLQTSKLSFAVILVGHRRQLLLCWRVWVLMLSVTAVRKCSGFQQRAFVSLVLMHVLNSSIWRKKDLTPKHYILVTEWLPVHNNILHPRCRWCQVQTWEVL